MEKSILIIFGPTGVGKTACAESIAQLYPIEIINMDMGQLYTPLTIGTAKPDWQSSPIPHHMFDVISEPCNFTVTQYRTRVQALIQEIWQRNKIPVLVGGSGFYLRSLLFPPSAASLHDTPEYPSDTDLWQELYAVDPERAVSINKNDVYRIKRALSIWHSTGQKPSSFVSQYEPIAPYKLICLTRDRADLYARINERVLLMFKEGWVDEVKRMRDTPWEQFVLQKKIIGYDDIVTYLRNEQTPEKLQKTVATIQQRTRHYAKRQMTYWRMLKKEIESVYRTNNAMDAVPLGEVDLTTGNLDLYIKRLLHIE